MTWEKSIANQAKTNNARDEAKLKNEEDTSRTAMEKLKKEVEIFIQNDKMTGIITSYTWPTDSVQFKDRFTGF